MVFNMKLQNSLIPFFSYTRKFSGLFILLIGFVILDILRPKAALGMRLSAKIEGLSGKSKLFHPTFLIGIVFALAFCPTLFWLFFGLVIPMSLSSSIGILLPLVFAAGNLIPVFISVCLMAAKGPSQNKLLPRFKRIQRSLRVIGGIALIVLGVLDSLIYWFL
jgi:cytochrome c biogenesis protein CcdA